MPFIESEREVARFSDNEINVESEVMSGRRCALLIAIRMPFSSLGEEYCHL